MIIFKKHIKHSLVMISVFFTLILALLTGCSKDHEFNTTTPKTFVLVHGAFQAAYAWDGVKDELIRQGHNVIVIELAGHGKDNTAPSAITMDTYRDAVLASIAKTDGKIILVGHSLGGMVISAVAESAPTKIERLIYLAAFVPKNGQQLLEIAKEDKQGELAPLLVPSADQLTLSIADISKIPDIFCAEGTAEIKKKLIDNYRPDPAIPFINPLTLTAANFGNATKSYIRTANDRALGINLQDSMIADSDIKDVYTIASGHCPHLSKPQELTALLLKIANK